MPPPEVTPLQWRDPLLGEIALPGGVLRLTLGVGSGLARRGGDPPGRFWGLGDRGPNLKIAAAVRDYGLTHLAHLATVAGAKVLPAPELGPTLAELQVTGDRVELVRTLSLVARDGSRVSGLPPPGGRLADVEPAFNIDGARLPLDPNGADTEGVVASRDGSFWIGEEYGPSLMHVDAGGRVLRRWAPPGTELAGVDALLPAQAAERRLNRGFEGLALSADERFLYVGFQSALEQPGAPTREALIWKLDAQSGACLESWAYPFDPPSSFLADALRGSVEDADLKVCELAWVAPDTLLVLERISRSGRIYRVTLAGGVVTKTLLFSTEVTPGIAADLEGMAVMSDRELLLATDNDFGVEGAPTYFYRLTFTEPLAG